MTDRIPTDARNYFRLLKWTNIRVYPNGELPEGAARDPAIRLYKESPDRAGLQVRGPRNLKRGASKTHSVIAHAHLSRRHCESLRDALNTLLDNWD